MNIFYDFEKERSISIVLHCVKQHADGRENVNRMSYYYDYYVGYEKDGKIYPWGPFDANGNIRPVISRSSSYASDLHEDFYHIKEEQVSDELRSKFESTDWNGNRVVDVKYLPYADLPSGTFVKSGYYLIKDVQAYEDDEDGYFDGFYDKLSPQIYVAKMENELKFGKNPIQKDEFGNEYSEPNASDYMYYAYPDYNCKEYEVFAIRDAVEMLQSYRMENEGIKYVILETEG